MTALSRLVTAKREAATTFGGPFSYATESHAFLVAFGAGYATALDDEHTSHFASTLLTSESSVAELRAESHYAAAGFVLGAELAER